MYKAYQIKNNDTLASIALMFNTDENTLMELNDIEKAIPGMTIVVPNEFEIWYKTYVIKPNDSLYSIALANNVSLKDLVAINGLDKDSYIYPNQEILIPKENVQIYITKAGDTLSSVARDMNETIDSLIKQNGKIYLLEDQLIINKK